MSAALWRKADHWSQRCSDRKAACSVCYLSFFKSWMGRGSPCYHKSRKRELMRICWSVVVPTSSLSNVSCALAKGRPLKPKMRKTVIVSDRKAACSVCYLSFFKSWMGRGSPCYHKSRKRELMRICWSVVVPTSSLSNVSCALAKGRPLKPKMRKTVIVSDRKAACSVCYLSFFKSWMGRGSPCYHKSRKRELMRICWSVVVPTSSLSNVSCALAKGRPLKPKMRKTVIVSDRKAACSVRRCEDL